MRANTVRHPWNCVLPYYRRNVPKLYTNILVSTLHILSADKRQEVVGSLKSECRRLGSRLE